MGNEMGNNNVTGLQASEETAHGADKINKPLDGSPLLNNKNSEKRTTDYEKDEDEDAAMAKSLKGTVISNGGHEEDVIDQNNSSTKVEDLDDKDMDSAQDDTPTQDDDLNNNFSAERDNGALKNEAAETTVNSIKISMSVSVTTENLKSNEDTSGSDKKVEQLVDVTRERTEESITTNSSSLLEENIEVSLEDEEECGRNEVVLVDSNLVGEDKIENLEHKQTEVSPVENQSVPMQRETTPTESIGTDYLDTDDSEIKVVMGDEPRERNSSPCVKQTDGVNQEISDDCNTEKTEEKVVNSEMDNSTPVQSAVNISEELKEDKRIGGLENKDDKNPEYSVCDNLNVGGAISKFQLSSTDSSATSESEMEKHEEQNEKEVIGVRNTSDNVTAPMEYYAVERTHMKEEVSVNEAVTAQKNLADNFGVDEELEDVNDIHDLVDIVEVTAKDFTKLESPLSEHLPTANKETVEKKEDNGEGLVEATTGTLEHDEETVKEIEEQGKTGNSAEGGDLLNLPTAVSIYTIQLVQDFDMMRDVEPDGLDPIGVIPSAHEAKIGNTHESMISSQCDQNHEILPEEFEVVKYENSEILSSCALSIEQGSATAVGLTTESNQKKVTAISEKASKEWHLLQTPYSVGQDGDETPLLQREESLHFFSHSTEQSEKEAEDVPVTNISVVEVKVSTEEESEKSPLLSPREPSGEFRAPKHSGRYNRPLQSLMTEDRVCAWSREKEQKSLPKSVGVNSATSKGKQRPKSSFFSSCMCCTTATN